MKTAALGVCLLAAIGAAHAGEIYKWTDENGKVHFSDVKPASPKDQAQPVEMKVHRPSEPERREAQARADREKSLLKGPEKEPAPAAAGSLATKPVAPDDSSCEAQWRKYNESSACFESFRQANGSVRAEAYQKCAEVKTPERCK